MLNFNFLMICLLFLSIYDDSYLDSFIYEMNYSIISFVFFYLDFLLIVLDVMNVIVVLHTQFELSSWSKYQK